jgi:arginyl-tRNA synthetase
MADLFSAVTYELGALLHLAPEDVVGNLAPPAVEGAGDLTLSCFRIRGMGNKNPAVVAGELARAINASAARSLISTAQPVGPYVNLILALGVVGEILIHNPKVPNPSGIRVMVEFSQPNTHKGFHVGHLRNLCLGDALVRLLRFCGDEVVAANYFGDVGTHIAKCLWWYLSLGDRTPPKNHRGEWLGELYSAASNQLSEWEDQAKLGDQASAKSLAKARAEISELLHKIEARDPELVAIWKETRQWSLDAFAEIYRWCGVAFDRNFYESEVDGLGLGLVEEYLQRGLFTESDGAVGIANNEVGHMPFFMLRKRDGTSLYSTKDLALARLKFEEYRIDRSIYVVDVRQSDHFRHVFLTLKKMGFPQADRCQHVPYEMVELPDGPMAARRGNVVLFRKLAEELTAHLREHHFRSRVGDWPEEEIAETLHQVALGAIKYGMLARDVNQKIVFEVADWLKFDGNTGPYLQYTGARANSILRKESISEGTPDFSLLVHPSERKLVLEIARMPQVLREAAEHLRPSRVCSYAHGLCKAFNGFYQACPVKGSGGPRLALVRVFAQALEQTLGVLGINIPPRM